MINLNPENLDKIIRELFKDSLGNPLKLAPTQLEIVKRICQLAPARNIAITSTQYGKSEALGVGALLRSACCGSRFAIVAPTKEKSGIIMDVVIRHCFDNSLFTSQLETEESLERLKRERSKDRVNFKRGGEVRSFTSQAKQKKVIKDALIGFGAQNLLFDESSLTPDDVYATGKRMVGGYKENFIFEIGNPWERNHFYKTWTQDENYSKIFVPYKKAIEEGRLTKEFADEMRGLPFFDILYECQFPNNEEVDRFGYRFLFKSSELESVFVPAMLKLQAQKKLGVDVARGGNKNVYTIRDNDFAFCALSDNCADTMATVQNIIDIAKKNNIPAHEVYIDDVGVGGGITDRLREKNFYCNAIKEGGKAGNERYANSKAQANFACRKWFLDGAKIYGAQYKECSEIKYKVNSNSKIAMEAKAELRERGIESPDFWDSLCLTFYPKTVSRPSITGL